MKDNKGKLQSPFRDGFCASICRYKPTPESSDGAGEASALAVAAVRLVWDVLRGRLVAGAPIICERVLVSQAGLVTVAFTL